MADDFVIVTTHPLLIKFVDHLQKKNAEALSFYPRCVFEREAEKQRIFLGLLNGQPCGYIYMGALNADVKCHQVCIEYDLRRRLYGASLVVAMEDYAMDGGAYTVTLRCGFDLQANDFWQSMGYSCVKIADGGIRRMRKINVWQKQIRKEFFDLVKLTPEKGKTNSSIWRKHKEIGTITGFARGRKLAEYRDLILKKDQQKKMR